MKKVLVFIALAGALSAAAWYILGTPRTPAGQPSLVSLSTANLSEFQAAFNNANDRPRLLLLLSPT